MLDKNLRDELRTLYVQKLTDLLVGCGEEVLRIKVGEIALPVVDSERNERFVRITVSVPTGERKDEVRPFDGYEMAQEFALNQKVKAEEKAKREAEKERKRKAAMPKAEN